MNNSPEISVWMMPYIMTSTDDGLERPYSLKMEFEGEGNYASTESKDCSGLTLSPKTQSSDPWLCDATIAISNEDFEALLGPLQLGLDGGELRRESSLLRTLLDHEHQLSEPPKKRRRLTRDSVNESVVESGHTVRENQSSCPLPSFGGNTKLDQQSEPTQASGQYPSAAVPRPFNSPGADSNFGNEVRTPNPSQNVEASDCPQSDEEVHQPIDNLECDEGSQHDLSSDVSDHVDEEVIQEDPVCERELAEKVQRVELLVSVDGHEAKANRGSYAQIWDPDVPIPSIEPEEEFIDGLNYEEWLLRGHKGPPKRLSKRATVELARSLGLGWFTFDNSLVGNNSAEKTPPATQYSNQQPENFSKLPHQGSLPLSIALALASPLQRPSLQKIIADTRELINSSKTQTSPLKDATSHDIPSELRQLFEKLEGKFNNDEQFRRSTVTWLVEKMSFSGKSSLVRHMTRPLLMGFSAVSPDCGRYSLKALNYGLENVYDLGSAVTIIFNERREARIAEDNYKSQLNDLHAYIKNLSSRHTDDTSRITELEIRCGELGRENIYFKSIAQNTKYQVKEATKIIMPTISKTGIDEKGDGISAPMNNRYWQCTIELTPGAPCLGVNQDYYQKGRQWLARGKCARCSKKNSDVRTRVYIDAKTAKVLGGVSSRLPSPKVSTPPATPAQQIQAQTACAQRNTTHLNPRGATNFPFAEAHYPPPTLQDALAAIGIFSEPAKVPLQATVQQTFQGAAKSHSPPTRAQPATVDKQTVQAVFKASSLPANAQAAADIQDAVQKTAAKTLSPSVHGESATATKQAVQEVAKAPTPATTADNDRRSISPYKPRMPSMPPPRTASMGSLTFPTLPAQTSIVPSLSAEKSAPPALRADKTTPPTLLTQNSTTSAGSPTKKRQASDDVTPPAKRVRKSKSPDVAPKKQFTPLDISSSTVDTLRAQLGKSHQRQWMKGPPEMIDLTDDRTSLECTLDALDTVLSGDGFEIDFDNAFGEFELGLDAQSEAI